MSDETVAKVVFRRSLHPFTRIVVTDDGGVAAEKGLNEEEAKEAAETIERLQNQHYIWKEAEKLGIVPYSYVIKNVQVSNGVSFVIANERFDMDLVTYLVRYYRSTNDVYERQHSEFRTQIIDLFSRLSSFVVCADIKPANVVVNLKPFKVALIDVDEDYCIFPDDKAELYNLVDSYRTEQAKEQKNPKALGWFIQQIEALYIKSQKGIKERKTDSIYIGGSGKSTVSMSDLQKLSATIQVLLLAVYCKTKGARNFLYPIFNDGFTSEKVHHGKTLSPKMLQQLEAVFNSRRFRFRTSAESYFPGMLKEGVGVQKLWEFASLI